MIMQIVLAPVERSVHVPRPPAEAFRLFTDGIATWWPTLTHSFGAGDVASVVFEGRAGGRVYEVGADGTETAWGDVVEWDPPRRFVLSWQVTRGRGAATEVEVNFVAADGGTRVELEHRGWERLGADAAAETRPSYDEGWQQVLGELERAAT